MNKILSLKVLALLVAPSLFIWLFPSWAEATPSAKGVPQKLTNSEHTVKANAPCALKQLNLNKEQQQKVETIIAEAHQQGHILKEQLRAKRRALMQYLQTPEANQTQALSMNGEINALQRQLGELRLKTFFSMRAQLNPEQIQKLQHLQKSRLSEPGSHYCRESEDKPDISPVKQPNR